MDAIQVADSITKLGSQLRGTVLGCRFSRRPVLRVSRSIGWSSGRTGLTLRQTFFSNSRIIFLVGDIMKVNLISQQRKRVKEKNA